MIRRILLGLLVIGAAALLWLHSVDYRPVVERAVARVVSDTRSNIDVDLDEVKLLFCGTGSPSRNP